MKAPLERPQVEPPCRPSGMPAASGGRLPYHSGLSRRVSMLPGETTFTRMLCGANSEASPRAKPDFLERGAFRRNKDRIAES